VRVGRFNIVHYTAGTTGEASVGYESTPYLTAGLPGAGGAIKTHPEVFRVTEVPLYAPVGSGTHV